MRVCLVCKALTRSALCFHCREGLLRLREPVVRDTGSYRIHSLFAWRHSSPRALAWAVRSLKGQEGIAIWRELGSWLMECFGPCKQAVFVPIPTHGHNHALGLARALAEWSGYPVAEALGAGQEREQKVLSREQRLDVHFERAIWDFCTEFTTVIIVDDVVTTGATARAAYSALGRPKVCEVWCLMDRRPCGPREGLL